jgi:ABC-2 type transport system ATP-binding protein
LPKQFQIISNTDNNYQIQITENATSNQLLNALIEKGEIISFQEKIPTMEDIFIKAVKDE